MFNSFYFIKFNISFSFYNIPSWGFSANIFNAYSFMYSYSNIIIQL